MNGAMTATNSGGRDLTSHARSRRSNVKNGRPESFDDSKVYEIVSDSADSRAARSVMRKKRIRRGRKRKLKSNNAALCCLSVGIFVTYALICVVLFQNITGEDGKGMRRLVKKTRERVRDFAGKHLRRRKQKLHSDEATDDRVDAKKPNASMSGIPRGIWPVSIRNEDGAFETIKHPGFDDGSVEVSVPRFWAEDPVAIHQNKLMTRERALSIGTCITKDQSTGSNNRGDKCSLSERTIFVAIASYRDWQCRDTVTSIFTRAKHPERLRVAVVDQIIDGDGSCDVPFSPCSEDPEQALCKYKDQIDVFQMDAELAVGPVFARHIGHRLYRGEYYSTQSDAHVSFVADWDVSIIDQIEATGDEMAVLSTYLTDVVGSISPSGKSLRNTRPIMCNTEYEGGVQGKHLRHLSQPEGVPDIRGSPQLQPYWAAGYSFSRGHFIATVPYDLYQPMIFQGEEMSIGLRGFTIGYDFFAPEESVCFHHYAKGENAEKRNKVHHFWEHSDKYAGTGIKAMKRVLGIVHMNPEVDPSEWNHAEEERYGLGGVRNTSKFYDVFGIDVVNKKTQRHLCQFVRGKMHKMFLKHLRPDGMGIDYDKIDFKWVDPRPNDP